MQEAQEIEFTVVEQGDDIENEESPAVEQEAPKKTTVGYGIGADAGF